MQKICHAFALIWPVASATAVQLLWYPKSVVTQKQNRAAAAWLNQVTGQQCAARKVQLAGVIAAQP
jgi:hypothetical protein